MSIGFTLLNISKCQSVLKYLSVTIWQIVYIYMTAISMNYAFAKLVVAWLYLCSSVSSSGCHGLVGALVCGIYLSCSLIVLLIVHKPKHRNSKRVWSGNTTITNRRQSRGTARKSRPTTTRNQGDKPSKATSPLLPTKMISTPEWTQSNAQQNIQQLQTSTMGVTINKKSTTTEPQLRTDRSPSHRGPKCTPLAPTLDSAVVEVQEMFSSHGGHLTNAMYHHGETL